jgi:hypothetical protein
VSRAEYIFLFEWGSAKMFRFFRVRTNNTGGSKEHYSDYREAVRNIEDVAGTITKNTFGKDFAKYNCVLYALGNIDVCFLYM